MRNMDFRSLFKRNTPTVESNVDQTAQHRTISNQQYYGVNSGNADLYREFQLQDLNKAKYRGFNASNGGNLFADWISPNAGINEILKPQLSIMRARCRERARNDDYVKGYIRSMVTNIIGPNGVPMNAMTRDITGERNELLSRSIESVWNDWGKYGKNVDVSSRNNWISTLEQILRIFLTDGEVFVRHIEKSRGKYSYSIEVIDPEMCDVSLNQELENGNRIIMGIEVDEWNSPIAYYFHTDNRYYGTIFNDGKARIRIPANEIVHVFMSEFPYQVRGIPPLVTALTRFKMLDDYETAALVNAKFGAMINGYFTRTSDDLNPANDQDDDGRLIEQAQPGMIPLLPQGIDFHQWTSEYPKEEFGNFKKWILRAVSAGIGLNYTTLAQDLENVNYSSIRTAVLEEREIFMGIQRFLEDSLITPIYERWLLHALSDGLIVVANMPIQLIKYDKCKDVTWRWRKWAWVDPAKDAQAALTFMKYRIKSPSTIAAENGVDWDDELQQIAKDENKLKQAGLTYIDPIIANIDAQLQEDNSIGDNVDGQNQN